MKTVFTNDMVAHVWAQQKQFEGRNSNRSFYFEYDTIYSYGSHFPIARFADPFTILFTTQSASITTSQHCSDVRRALSNDLTILHCENVQAGKYPGTAKSDHELNIKAMEKVIQDFIKAAKRSIKYAASQRNSAYAHIADRQAYIDFFKMDKRKFRKFEISKDDQVKINMKIARAEVQEKEAKKRNELKQQARIKEAKARLKDITEIYGTLEDICEMWRDNKPDTAKLFSDLRIIASVLSNSFSIPCSV